MSSYTTLRPIASGGMGTVYLGRREGLGGFSRLVALKRAHPDLASKPSVQRRFVREANAASMLHHANVVAVVDLFTKDGDSWLVLDWVDGVSLSELLIERGQLPLRVAIHILLDACAGLAAAHELRVDDAPLGLQHRDVSPGNILVGRDGVARIADFGLARTFDTTLTNTEDRFLEGKLGYLAPELFQGKDFDERCDLYALGVVAWEALAGMRLFRARTLTKLVAEQRAPTKLAAIYPALAWLDPVIDRAMSFDPRLRAASVREFMTELARAAEAHGALGTADDVARFMLDAPGIALADVSAETPITTGLGDPTPATGPLLQGEVDAPEVSSGDIAVASAPTLDDGPVIAMLSRDEPSGGDEPDAPTPPPPNRASLASMGVTSSLEAVPTAEAPRIVPSLSAGSFLGSRPRTAPEDPISLESSIVAAPKPRAGLWLAALAAVAAISVGLISLTRSDDEPVAASSAVPPRPSTPHEETSPSASPTSADSAIVIGHEEAASARLRERDAPQRASASSAPTIVSTPATETKTGPPITAPAPQNALPDNPYRKKSP